MFYTKRVKFVILFLIKEEGEDQMNPFILRVLLYLSCFIISFWSLMGLDFERFIHKGKTAQAQMIVFLGAMAMAYLIAQFIMNLMYRNIFM